MSADVGKTDFLILCGGLGTRLRSVTGGVPKVMAEADSLSQILIKEE